MPLFPPPPQQLPVAGQGYQVLYWNTSTTIFLVVPVNRNDATGLTLTGLTPYTNYSVVVRLFCGEGMYGPATRPVEFRTLAESKLCDLFLTIDNEE